MSNRPQWKTALGPVIEDRMRELMERDPLLQEREKTHGSFQRNAEISQKLKEVIHNYTMYRTPQFPLAQVEALEMICLKISRILSGKNYEKDHWDDIAGYAKLASEACDR